ncbi:hypothetical protein [Stenotrophomonas phage YB07]|uniref:Uncharacterized protein n=1 Tax=Stenotrophomonas phage YB07 TaxID=2555548 RepID=A0A482IFQ0_9CAUD|nr:hypothetical protein HWC11_gp212 [Stenotrophomonas phage YB07]QBP06408.1 hypothetical protein [Stenotrophomonas phage YB07]
MDVHVIVEHIDLGDQVIGVYADKEHAKSVCDELNEDFKAQYISHVGNRYSVETHTVVRRLHRWCGPTEN